MKLDYKRYYPHPCHTGDTITIEKKAWDCVVPCTMIGATWQNHIPVIEGPDGPRVINGELIPANILRTKGKPGQVPIEVMTLGEYKQIGPLDLKGCHIVDIRWTGYELIIICEDKTYIKLSPDSDEYVGLSLATSSLTMCDLRDMGQLIPDDWERFKKQQQDVRMARKQRAGEEQLKSVIAKLGIKAVKEIVNQRGN